MEFDQVVKRTRDLEIQILRSLGELVKDYERDTGLTPVDIHVYIEPCVTIGPKKPRNVVTRVDVEINLR